MSKVTVKSKDESGKAPAPAPRETASPLTDLRSEIDRLFSEFSGRFPTLGGGRSLFDWEPWRVSTSLPGLAAPKVDLSETDRGFEVVAEIPGIDPKDVSVELKDDVLTISGEKREEKEEKKKDYHLSERRFGSFKRSFRLPSDVDFAKAEAAFDKGVLHVTLPKNADAKPKSHKIEVKAK